MKTKGTLRVSQNKSNPNLFRYESALDRLNHAIYMRREGKVTLRNWTEVGENGVKRYFAEYKEVSKA